MSTTPICKGDWLLGTACGQCARCLETAAAAISTLKKTIQIGEKVLSRTLAERDATLQTPIPMILFCPQCGTQHVDAPEPARSWTNPPHRSHECQRCRLIWRPCDLPTTGVTAIATTGQHDSPPIRECVDMIRKLQRSIKIGDEELRELQQGLRAARVEGRRHGINEVADAFANLPAIAVGIRAMVDNSGLRWRHVRRGTSYTEIGRGELQISRESLGIPVLVEGSRLVAYRGDDGKVYFRPERQFDDGRFERILT